MRAFFALGFDREDVSAIDTFCTTQLPPFTRPVALENLHMTLVFLGDITATQCDRLISDTGQLSSASIDFNLNRLEFWPGQEIACLAPDVAPVELNQLVDQLRRLAARVNLRVERRKFKPHVTLARRCNTPAPTPLTPPDIAINCAEFSLFESIRQPQGVSYRPIASFPLR